jgi:tetratricopeptide (TPR) repeat protein
LAALVWIVFGQTLQHEFVNFDDDVYVYQNPMVTGGLTPAAVAWAFTHPHQANWHPLTSLSHILDCQFYGLNAGGHHFTNVLLHGASAILLFLVLRRMTAALWPSALVAALFAIHPLRVESVAWISERKDVLSGFFFVLTLGAYLRYVRRPKSLLHYLLVLFLFVLGLMSKPMLVTLPFVLLLLDYWPLGRFPEPARFPIPQRLLLEKMSCVITLRVQSEAIQDAQVVPMALRIENAIVSAAAYLAQMVYPANLALCYPYPINGLPPWQIALALLVLVAVSAAAFYWRNQRPWLLTGWFWYLGMLLPVAGLVQVGGQARADRYTYLPQIGVYLLLTWTLVELGERWRNRRLALAGGAAAALAILAACARAQTGYWRNSESLWTRALACTSNNALAESNLGSLLYQDGRLDEALAHGQKALEIQPDNVGANNCVGFVLLQKGHVDEAIAHFQTALRARPDYAPAHSNLGMALFQLGRVDEAIAHFRSALEADPTVADIHNNLGAALVQKGQFEEAVADYQKALELRPDYPGACNNLAWVLATSPQASIRNGARAVQLARQANQLTGGGNLVILRTLAAAYAEAGRFPEAIETANQALQLATAQGKSAWANTLQKETRLYQAAFPLRDPLPTK